jgi:hypothetical protein
MADWIDDLKKSELAREVNDREQNRIRLHNAEIIKAKVPAIWQSIKQELQADSEKLRQTFPSNPQYHCMYQELGPDQCSLTGDSLDHAYRITVTLRAIL